MLKKGLKEYPFDKYGYPEIRVIDDTDFACGEMWSLGDNPVAGLMLNSQMHDAVITGAPYINDDSTYTLRPDNPHKIAVYNTVDAHFILNDLFAKLRYQYGDEA